MKAIPDNPRGNRSKSWKIVAREGKWNTYDVCVDGVVKLSVNGKLVNEYAIRSIKKGISLESEGAEIHFRNLKILELPGGVISPEEIAPLAEINLFNLLFLLGIVMISLD